MGMDISGKPGAPHPRLLNGGSLTPPGWTTARSGDKSHHRQCSHRARDGRTKGSPPHDSIGTTIIPRFQRGKTRHTGTVTASGVVGSRAWPPLLSLHCRPGGAEPCGGFETYSSSRTFSPLHHHPALRFTAVTQV